MKSIQRTCKQDNRNTQKYSNLVILCDEFDLSQLRDIQRDCIVIYPCRLFLYKVF